LRTFGFEKAELCWVRFVVSCMFSSSHKFA
jgi:hypothetical protein